MNKERKVKGDKTLGQQLKIARKKSRLTQQQVADKLNIDRSTYAKYELGTSTPNIHMEQRPYMSYMTGEKYTEEEFLKLTPEKARKKALERELQASYSIISDEKDSLEKWHIQENDEISEAAVEAIGSAVSSLKKALDYIEEAQNG